MGMGNGELHLEAGVQLWVEMFKNGYAFMSLDLHNALKIFV